MPLGFEVLYEPKIPLRSQDDDAQLVDIVAIPDAYEDSSSSWTSPETGLNWLRDLLPRNIRICRVITYSYDATVESFFSDDAPGKVQRLAECLVQELRANRQLAGSLGRPIIFLCHGLGGILAKKSLCYSSTRVAPKIVHLWDQYISTFAIIFYGTPHGRMNKTDWLALERHIRNANRSSSQRLLSSQRSVSEGHAQVAQSVDKEFSPLAKQFHMFFFWENLPTELGDRSVYIVDSESATPNLDNIEMSGVHANHLDMVRFTSSSSSDYRTTIAALATYCQRAPGIITHRWAQADKALIQLRAGEAWELGGFGFDVRSEEPFRSSDIPIKRHFHPPQEPTPLFIGRKEMYDALCDAFFPEGTACKTTGRKSFVIFGMGGSGKTELCSKYASDLKHMYEAVFTIRAASEKTIRDSFATIGQLAELEPTESAGRHFLGQLKEPWLLIIDNADSRALDIKGLFPMGNAAHIIVTTRNADFRQQGTLGSLELQGLQENEALHLLLSTAHIPRPWDADTTSTAKKITSALGCLALALIQAGTCIYREVCKIGEYLKVYKDTRESLLQRRVTLHPGSQNDVKGSETEDEESEDIVKAVYSAFDVSFKHMRKSSTRSQDASELLNILSSLHFERIPRELFTRAVKNRSQVLRSPCRPYSAEAVKQSILRRIEPPAVLPGFLKDTSGKLNEHRVNWAIGELKSLSLISINDQFISIHPLVRDWARDRLSPLEQKSWAGVAFNTIMESICLPPRGSSETDGEYHRDILPHLEICMEASGDTTAVRLASSHQTGALGAFFNAVFLTRTMIVGAQIRNAGKCGWLYAERGLFEQAKFHLEATQKGLFKLLGETNEKTLTATRALAGVHWGLDRAGEAISLQRKVVNAHTRMYGDSHHGTLQAMVDLGRSYWLFGSYSQALELQLVTADKMQRLFGPSDARYKDTLAALDSLGVTLGAWRRYHESLEIHQEVLRARKRILGHRHLDTLATSSNLAMALLDLGRVDEARAHMKEVHEQRQLQLGKEHPWTLWALVYVARIHSAAGELAEAESMLDWGIEAGKRSLREGHIGIYMGLGELSRVYARQDRFEEAERIGMDTLQGLEKALGIAHPDVIYCGFKLAQLFMRQRKRKQAIQFCHQSLERVDLRVGKTHPLSQDLVRTLRVLMDPSVASTELYKHVQAQHLIHATDVPDFQSVTDKLPTPQRKLTKNASW